MVLEYSMYSVQDLKDMYEATGATEILDHMIRYRSLSDMYIFDKGQTASIFMRNMLEDKENFSFYMNNIQETRELKYAYKTILHILEHVPEEDLVVDNICEYIQYLDLNDLNGTIQRLNYEFIKNILELVNKVYYDDGTNDESDFLPFGQDPERIYHALLYNVTLRETKVFREFDNFLDFVSYYVENKPILIKRYKENLDLSQLSNINNFTSIINLFAQYKDYLFSYLERHQIKLDVADKLSESMRLYIDNLEITYENFIDLYKEMSHSVTVFTESNIEITRLFWLVWLTTCDNIYDFAKELDDKIDDKEVGEYTIEDSDINLLSVYRKEITKYTSAGLAAILYLDTHFSKYLDHLYIRGNSDYNTITDQVNEASQYLRDINLFPIEFYADPYKCIEIARQWFPTATIFNNNGFGNEPTQTLLIKDPSDPDIPKSESFYTGDDTEDNSVISLSDIIDSAL